MNIERRKIHCNFSHFILIVNIEIIIIYIENNNICRFYVLSNFIFIK
jgi:hypothetical protein